MLPVVFEAYKWTRRRTSTPRQAPLHDKSWWRLIRLPALVTSIFAAGFVLVDTLYFRGILSWPVLTPLNFWSYNSSPSSLEHGHHPAWLHVVVNLPMIVGPGMLIYGIIAARDLFKPQRHYSGAEGDVGAVMKRSMFRHSSRSQCSFCRSISVHDCYLVGNPLGTPTPGTALFGSFSGPFNCARGTGWPHSACG